ncbi:NADPH-dependent FMN reductase [Actinokineospora sp. G85]|uniref:NADPH-dependent FMN reductase n=1 Tax=Actinokineospora sp. G85 TaxID=3406626 RepID=UPI003C718208
MPDRPIRVVVTVGSTRAGRFAPIVASWFVKRASARPDLVVDVVDLAETRLPDALTGFGSLPPEAVTALLPRLAAADAFVVVTPEYNHSYPAPIKTLIDWFFAEWQAKPVGFVSYGGHSGGLRAVEHLRQVFAEVHAVGIRDTVSFHGARDQFDADGVPVDTEGATRVAEVMLDQLTWWALALREAKEETPLHHRLNRRPAPGPAPLRRAGRLRRPARVQPSLSATLALARAWPASLGSDRGAGRGNTAAVPDPCGRRPRWCNRRHEHRSRRTPPTSVSGCGHGARPTPTR